MLNTDIRTDIWLDGLTLTPPRRAAFDAMEREDEGLTRRAYRAILQVGDCDMRLRPADAAWLWDQPMGPPIVEWLGVGGGWRLTAFGQQIYEAANAGDYRTIIRLTTDKTFGEWVN